MLIVILISSLLLPLCAQQKDAGMLLLAPKVEPKHITPRATDASHSIFEVYKSFTVPPGQSISFDAISDYTGADRASIAIQCPASTDLRNVQLLFFWTMEMADWYVGTDFVNGNLLAFTNMGGAVTTVFGSRLRVEVKNNGTLPAACNQLMIYAVVR
jgi:hypothetical protein